MPFKISNILFPLILILLFTATPLLSQPKKEKAAGVVASSAEKINPLKVGATIPNARLQTVAGDKVGLKNLVKEKPALIIFYRGGWCPYCNSHLGALGSIESKLDDLGFRIIAISPDKPKKLAKGKKEHNLTYMLLSDSSMKAAKKFGLAFRVDDQTFKKYKEEYGIDLEEHSGEDHHLLPVPAAFLVSTSGKILFAHSDPDYKARVDLDRLLSEAGRFSKTST